MFYGTPLPDVTTLASLDPNLISGTLNSQGLSDETYRLLLNLHLSSKANVGQGSAIDGFVKEILRMFGYERHQSAPANICLVQGSSIILLVVHEDKNLGSGRNLDPQIIAEAIATFQSNNRTRAELGQPELNSMTIPCITTIGTRPIFYLVPVTQELSEAVATAQYPCSPTVVKKCVVASGSNNLHEGMETPDFRQLALRHYTAFRTLAEAHWSALYGLREDENFTCPAEYGTSGG